MADCTQTPLGKASYRTRVVRAVGEAVSSIQPSIVNTLVSFAITQPNPFHPQKKEKRKERERTTRAEHVNRDLLPKLLMMPTEW